MHEIELIGVGSGNMGWARRLMFTLVLGQMKYMYAIKIHVL